MGKTPKSTKGQEIIITETYPEDLSHILMPCDLEVLKEKYGDKPCTYEVKYPWKENRHITWFVDDIYERYSESHIIIRQKSE